MEPFEEKMAAEYEQLDRMFGKGQWVVCMGCPRSPQEYAVHHRNFDCGATRPAATPTSRPRASPALDV